MDGGGSSSSNSTFSSEVWYDDGNVGTSVGEELVGAEVSEEERGG